MKFMIYPVYYRIGYGFQTNDPKGTNGIPESYVLYEECLDGGEGWVITTFGVTMIEEMQEVADYLNAREVEQ